MESVRLKKKKEKVRESGKFFFLSFLRILIERQFATLIFFVFFVVLPTFSRIQ